MGIHYLKKNVIGTCKRIIEGYIEGTQDDAQKFIDSVFQNITHNKLYMVNLSKKNY